MIRAILLAAGKGSRMGIQKQLLNWSGDTLLEESINEILQLNKIDELTIVLGHNAVRIKDKIKNFENEKVNIVINKNYDNGMHTSIRAGIKDMDPKIKHIMIALGDQPLIDKKLFSDIIDRYLSVDKECLVPVYKGKRGHPVIIKRDFLEREIDGIDGPGGLRKLIKERPEKIFFYEIDKEEVIIDLDYYDEYKLYRKKKAKKNNSWFLNYKFWLEGEEKIFGDGPCDILVRIDHFGSLKKAAEDMNMSYSQAWKLINKIEDNLGFKLIEKRVGGRAGGGSELTEKGRKLMNDFLSFRREIHDHIIELEDKYFSDWKDTDL